MLLEGDVASELMVMAHVVDSSMAGILPQNRSICIYKFYRIPRELCSLASVMEALVRSRHSLKEKPNQYLSWKWSHSLANSEKQTQNCFQLLLLRRPKQSEIEQTKLETYPVAVVALKVFRICKEKMICTRIWAARWPCEIERWLWVPSVPQGVTIPLDKLQLGPARSR